MPQKKLKNKKNTLPSVGIDTRQRNLFAECDACSTRQRQYVYRVPYSTKAVFAECQTLGKRPLCRVSGTRQRRTLGKIPQPTPVAPPSSFVECWPLALGKCSVFVQCCKPGTRQRGSFAECQFRHSAKYFFFKFFLWHLYSTLKHMFQFGTFL